MNNANKKFGGKNYLRGVTILAALVLVAILATSATLISLGSPDNSPIVKVDSRAMPAATVAPVSKQTTKDSIHFGKIPSACVEVQMTREKTTKNGDKGTTSIACPQNVSIAKYCSPGEDYIVEVMEAGQLKQMIEKQYIESITPGMWSVFTRRVICEESYKKDIFVYQSVHGIIYGYFNTNANMARQVCSISSKKIASEEVTDQCVYTKSGTTQEYGSPLQDGWKCRVLIDVKGVSMSCTDREVMCGVGENCNDKTGPQARDASAVQPTVHSNEEKSSFQKYIDSKVNEGTISKTQGDLLNAYHDKEIASEALKKCGTAVSSYLCKMDAEKNIKQSEDAINKIIKDAEAVTKADCVDSGYSNAGLCTDSEDLKRAKEVLSLNSKLKKDAVELNTKKDDAKQAKEKVEADKKAEEERLRLEELSRLAGLNPGTFVGPGGGGGPGGSVGGVGTQSPLGGECVTRYVCANNTIYYQGMQTVSDGYTTQSRCLVQPMQQCQYGCAGANGASQGQSGSGGMDIGMIGKIIGSLGSLIGGGGNGATGMAAPTSSTCAQQPQNQQQSKYGTGTNGQPCPQPPVQPSAESCNVGTWKATSSQQNGCVTGYQCVPGGNNTNATAPQASISCQPTQADAGMNVVIAYGCVNANVSVGSGFDTGGALSGTSTAVLVAPNDNSGMVPYGITCSRDGVTASDQCRVQVNNSGIVLVANPETVNPGETASLGWITNGMRACTISSTDFTSWSAQNANNTSVNGTAITPSLARDTGFTLTCTTISGTRKSSSIEVKVR